MKNKKKGCGGCFLIISIILVVIVISSIRGGCIETTPEKVEELIEEDTEADLEEMIIEEDTQADIEEIYLSEITIITLFLTNSLNKYGQASSDMAEGKISIAEHKAITEDFIEEVKDLYYIHLALKPPKRLEKANDLIGEAMQHNLNSTIFLQSYIDTDNMEKMAGYLDQSTAEINLATEDFLKATELIKNIK